MHSLFTKTVFLSILVICTLPSFSQTAIGTNPPDPHAMLDIQSTTKGVLIPALSAGQLATLAATLTSSEKGMLVTDAATGKPLEWNGGEWVDIANLSADPPLVVSSTNQISFNPGTQVGDLITWDGNNWVNMQPAIQHFNFTLENRQPYLALSFCIALAGIFPARSDPFLSQIQIFPFNFPPKGWAFCNGQILSISQNTALFSLLGTFYGGNGVSNFALPDLQSRAPLKFGQGPGLSDYQQGETGGTESNTISQ